MCLRLSNNPDIPHNSKTIRWKRIYTHKGQPYTPYRRRKLQLNKWNHAKLKDDWGSPLGPSIAGFHVYVTRKDARRASCREDIVVKVEVNGFLKSGTFRDDRSETWRRMKILSSLPKE